MAFSVNTNAGALSGLRALNATAGSLATTQARINTGLEIAGARDGAAGYAIAQTLRADIAGLRSVGNSLDRAQSTLDVSIAAAEAVSDLLVDMRELAVAGADTGLDQASRIALNQEFLQIRDQIDSIVNEATFNGTNILTGSATLTAITNDTGSQSISLSLTANPVTLSGLQLDTINLAGNSSLVVTPTTLTDDDNFALSSGLAETDSADGYYAMVNFIDDPANQAALNTAINTASLGSSGFSDLEAAFDRGTGLFNDSSIASGVAAALDAAFSETDFDSESAGTPGQFVVDVIEGSPTNSVFIAAAGQNSVFTDSAADVTISISGDGSTPDTAQLAVTAIDSAIQTVNGVLSDLGAMSQRLELQQNFTTRLVDGITVGIGDLVDADLPREAARLQAFQTQQQLGLQALSIANQAPQAILSLFG